MRAPCVGACDRAPVAAVGHLQVMKATATAITPVIFIWAFNLILLTSVPLNVISYFIVAVILILVAIVSGLIGLAGRK